MLDKVLDKAPLVIFYGSIAFVWWVVLHVIDDRRAARRNRKQSK